MKVSATVITFNEEDNIACCLDSLKDWVDEIIVVDSGSTDRTLDIIKNYNVKIFHRKFDNYANQKNWALNKASGKWIISVDADEVITPSLAQEIQERIDDLKYKGYLIPRKNFILGAEIKHSRWSPDEHIWLWQKDSGYWQGDVHEEVVVDGPVGKLKEAKVHYQDKTIREFIQSNHHYAQLLSKKMFKNNQAFSIFRFLYDPIFEFTIRYIYKKGFLDGWRGLILAILMAWYKIEIWWKLLLLQLQNNNKK